MRFSVHYGSVGDTLIAVGESPPYATIVIPGKKRESRVAEESFLEGEVDVENEVVETRGRGRQKVLRTRRQLEALKPGASSTVPTKFGFLELLQSGDVFLITAGGIGSIFARQAAGRGATVLTIPTFDLAALRHEFFENELEPQIALAEIYRRVPDRFRSIPEYDERVTELRILSRARLAVMGDFRRPAEQRMERTLEDLALLAPASTREARARITWAARVLMRRPMERLETDEERFRTLAALLEQMKTAETASIDFRLPSGFASCQKDIARSIKAIEIERRGMEENPISYQARLAEKELAAEISRALDRMPVWHNLFSQVPGMGPLIAAMVISEVYHIDRFATPYKLANYAGWGFDRKTNLRQRHRRGHVSGLNENLKHAFFVWMDGIVKMGRRLVVRADKPLTIGDRVRLLGIDYEKNDAGLPVTSLKDVALADALDEFEGDLAKLRKEKEPDLDELAALEALIAELAARVGHGDDTVQVAVVALNDWRAYYDAKYRMLLAKHPVPIKEMRMMRVLTEDGPKQIEREFLRYTPQWIHRTACAKTITQLIDYLWTAWTKLEAPEVYEAWHRPREERWRAAGSPVSHSAQSSAPPTL